MVYIQLTVVLACEGSLYLCGQVCWNLWFIISSHTTEIRAQQ